MITYRIPQVQREYLEIVVWSDTDDGCHRSSIVAGGSHHPEDLLLAFAIEEVLIDSSGRHPTLSRKDIRANRHNSGLALQSCQNTQRIREQLQ